MLKHLLTAVVAFVAGVVITTQKKDQEILRLQKRIAKLKSYKYYGPIFRKGWQRGYERARLDMELHKILHED